MELAFRESGSGKPLIILHGLFGQSDNWNTLAKNFATQGFRVFTIDQRNHGLSPHSDTWDFPSMAEDLNEFITQHQLKHPILLGHSMGAKTVMYFEQMHPGIASKLVIVDISAKKYEPHHQDVIKALNSVDFNKIKSRKDVEAVLDEHLSDAGTKQFLLKNLYWKDEANRILDWRFNLKVISDLYESVTVDVPFYTSQTPTMIVRGSKSNYIGEKDLKDYEKRFPNHRFVTIEGAAHWVHAEKPVDFFEKVLEFIKG